jgi:hypothetical protein
VKQQGKQLPEVIDVIGLPPQTSLSSPDGRRRKPTGKGIGTNVPAANAMQGNAKIPELQNPVTGNENIVGSDVTMYRARSMDQSYRAE